MKESLTQETHATEEKSTLLDTRDKNDEIIAPVQTVQEKISESKEKEKLTDISQNIPSATGKETSTEVATEKPVVETAFEKSSTEFKDEIPQDTNLRTSLGTQTTVQQIAEQSPINILGEQTTSQQVSMTPSSCLVPEKPLLQVVPGTTSDVQDTYSTEEKEYIECPLQTSKKQDEDQTITPVKKENVSTEPSSSLQGIDRIDTSTLSQHIDETIAKAVSDLNVMENITKSSSIRDEQHAEMLSAAAEILTTSPVPIQVAESVLQAEPKESISDELKTITEGVISSTVTPIHESSAVSVEATIKDKTEINGAPSDEKKDADKISSRSAQATISDAPLLKESEITQTTSQSQMESIENVSDVKPSVTETLPAETGATEFKESVQIEGTEATTTETEKLSSITSDILTSSVSLQTESPKLEKISILESTEIQKTSEPTQSTTSESPQDESPIRPTRTKELNIPPTPTVTEATPPTSPPIDLAQDVEGQGKSVKKTQKKTIKKTASESDTAEGVESEGTEKKSKKVVKKTGKKSKDSQDEGAESSSTTDKPKKTGKVTKKITKPTQTLGADTSVPDTPPPGSSDAPVPPKRKVKSTTAAKPAAAKKPDTEE